MVDMNEPISTTTYLDRIARARASMAATGVDVLLVSVGSDLPYLTGYEAMPLERLTMLVVPRDGEATLVIPRLEAPRVVEQPGVFELQLWDETEDPVAIVARLAGPPATVAVGDTMWARFVVGLLEHWPSNTTQYLRSATVMSALRMCKDAAEIAALQAAGAAADRVAGQLHAGEIPLVGRTEAAVSADISARLLAEGHDVVNFAIVAAGENAASPHHHASERVIRHGELVLCDFGGTMNGYCSDITRCVSIGEPPAEVADAYAVLFDAQAAGMSAGVVGAACEDVDRAARRIIDDAGYGEHFIHRTGHGIGMEAHEDPYMVEGNTLPIAPGHAFSVEPGIYLSGRWGMRLEDCVVATADGPLALNDADHSLVVVEC
ncbi:MAG: putative dipeptidase [Ilumatobacteraceae bacterium]|nr:putative dipeptidase [Ilumatobacteraceae bacterium]